jgi:N-acyl-D-amino-acid deacylase
MLDKIIRGGTVVDGSGLPAYRADVGIERERIAVIGNLAQMSAGDELDAAGLVVSPGFIDMHSHSDLVLMEDPRGQSKIRQGVTTELVGQCGFSPFPLTKVRRQIPLSELEVAYSTTLREFDWTDLAGYAQHINRQGSAINIAPLVGHGAVRAAVMGYDNRPPTPEELEQMRRLVAQAMEHGAFGMSVGLTLQPGIFAAQEEVIALAEVAGRYGGIYDSHGRGKAGNHLFNHEEAAHIGRAGRIAVQLAHMAIVDNRYWGKAEEVTAAIERANAEGGDVAYDLYPYVASASMLSQMLPGWVQEGGAAGIVARLRDPQTRQKILKELDAGWYYGIPFRWESFYVASPGEKGDPAWVGKHLQQIAEEMGVLPKEAFLRLIETSEDGVLSVQFNRTEEDLQHFLKHRLSMIGSDGNAVSADGPLSRVNVHPRFYGTFPRVLGRYVRELKVLTLEEAVHKMTGRPAARLRLRDRGRVAPGYVADVTLFDPATVADRATFESSHQYPVGIPHVMVKGQWVLRQGEHTGARPAGVLRHGSGS